MNGCQPGVNGCFHLADCSLATANADEVAAIIQRARDEGVRSPFVKLITQDDEPIWMGWL
jgi:hypothetical protein